MASSFEIGKGYENPLLPKITPFPLPPDVAHARDDIKSKRKMTKMLRPNVTSTPKIESDDLVQVFINRDHEK